MCLDQARLACQATHRTAEAPFGRSEAAGAAAGRPATEDEAAEEDCSYGRGEKQVSEVASRQ
jgi:hypothetical protein